MSFAQTVFLHLKFDVSMKPRGYLLQSKPLKWSPSGDDISGISLYIYIYEIQPIKKINTV